MLVRLDSRASTNSPFMGTGSDTVIGQSDIIPFWQLAVCFSCAGMVLLTANAGACNLMTVVGYAP